MSEVILWDPTQAGKVLCCAVPMMLLTTGCMASSMHCLHGSIHQSIMSDKFILRKHLRSALLPYDPVDSPAKFAELEMMFAREP